MKLRECVVRRRKLGVVAALGVSCSLLAVQAREARAQLPVDLLVREHPRFAARVLSPSRNAGKPARFIVPSRQARASLASVGVEGEFLVVPNRDRGHYQGVLWSPPKRLLLDQVNEWVDTAGYRQLLLERTLEGAPGGVGNGVTIGIVDGGIDLRHPDLRNADGSTRAAWLLDFSSGPRGFHSELEEQYGCTDAETPCAILGAEQINQALLDASAAVTLPRDRLGHGTHVASIAAGGGQAEAQLRGIAPETSLVVALLAVDSVEVQDADVLLASKFVFDRAEEAGQPAVVNLSLGGDFGPHDGSTLLERALVALLDRPGRAMIVAAGNSGGVFTDGPDDLEGPFGIHRDVRVRGESVVELAIPSDQSSFEGDVLVWVDTKPGESLSVGVETAGDVVVPPVGGGDSAEGTGDGWDALVSNQASLEDPSLSDYESGALLLLTGTFTRDEVIRLRLVGDANAGLWVQGTGELSSATGTRGPLFALARVGGTITVPATAPELIAVGATLNRDSWQSRSGGATNLALFTEQLDDTIGSVGFFSSVGPNQVGHFKPNILAPGAAVVAAMAPSADPMPPGGSRNAVSMFNDSALCETDPLCTVVDDNYGVAIGTSMAAPVVTGAVALLLEQNPDLTQAEVLRLLQAGVTRQAPSKTTPKWEKDLPPASGLLNLPRTLSALELLSTQTSVAAAKDQSWLAFADSYVSPGQEVEVQLWARTADGAPAFITSDALKVTVTNGDVSREVTRLAPGLFRLGLKAADDAPLSGGPPLEVRIRYDGETLAQGSLPVAGDLADVRGIARATPVLREEESCALIRRQDASPFSPILLAVAWLALRRRRAAK